MSVRCLAVLTCIFSHLIYNLYFRNVNYVIVIFFNKILRKILYKNLIWTLSIPLNINKSRSVEIRALYQRYRLTHLKHPTSLA